MDAPREDSVADLQEQLDRRTRELAEALEQQAATSEILGVISSSPTDAQPVFDAIVASGLKLFPGATVLVALADGDQVKAAAVSAPDPAGVEAVQRRMPLPLTREYMTSTAILDCRVVDIPDAENVPAELAVGARNFLASGYRAMTAMPMLRGDVAIGTLSVLRLVAGPLSRHYNLQRPISRPDEWNAEALMSLRPLSPLDANAASPKRQQSSAFRNRR